MSRTLLTHWSEVDSAIDRVLGLAQQRLLIFDFDLLALKLEQPGRHQLIRSLLAKNPKMKSIFVVQDASRLFRDQPRLIKLLDDFQNNFSLVECAESLRELPDSMLIADSSHALIRFQRQLPRGKLLESDAAEVFPYVKRFDDIVGEGGAPISARSSGL